MSTKADEEQQEKDEEDEEEAARRSGERSGASAMPDLLHHASVT